MLFHVSVHNSLNKIKGGKGKMSQETASPEPEKQPAPEGKRERKMGDIIRNVVLVAFIVGLVVLMIIGFMRQ